MGACVISNIGRRAFIQFDQIIKEGEILVTGKDNDFVGSYNLFNSNSFKIELPKTGTNFTIRIYFDDSSIEKQLYIKKS